MLCFGVSFETEEHENMSRAGVETQFVLNKLLFPMTVSQYVEIGEKCYVVKRSIHFFNKYFILLFCRNLI